MTRKSIPFYVLIGVVLTGSIAITGGIWPKSPHSPAFDIFAKKTTPLPTLPPSCSQKLAIDFLVDNSASMAQDELGGSGVNVTSKLDLLKQALTTFTQDFSDSSIVGMQSFSGATSPLTPRPPKNEIPIDTYNIDKAIFPTAVNGMIASGGTYTRDAFSFTKTILDPALQLYPTQKFALVFISDGIPEVYNPQISDQCEIDPATGQKLRCFATEQDPTTFPDIAAAIKNEGVRIFTIAYLDANDTYFNNSLQTMMTTIATSPTDFYTAPNNADIQGILGEIAQQICQ